VIVLGAFVGEGSVVLSGYENDQVIVLLTNACVVTVCIAVASINCHIEGPTSQSTDEFIRLLL